MTCNSTSPCQNVTNKKCEDVTLTINDGYGMSCEDTMFEIYQGPIDMTNGNTQLQFNYYIGDDVYYQQIYMNFINNKVANMPLLVRDDYLCIELTNLTANSASYTLRYSGTDIPRGCGLGCGIVTIGLLGLLFGTVYMVMKNRHRKMMDDMMDMKDTMMDRKMVMMEYLDI